MSDGPKVIEAGDTRVNTSAGHLSLHVIGAHPAEIDFSFDREPRRLSASFVVSGVIQIAFVALCKKLRQRRHSIIQTLLRFMRLGNTMACVLSSRSLLKAKLCGNSYKPEECS